MDDKKQIALEMTEMMSTRGWQRKQAQIKEQIHADVDELINLMCRSPEKLTGKVAFKLGIRVKVNRDLLDGLQDEIQMPEMQKD